MITRLSYIPTPSKPELDLNDHYDTYRQQSARDQFAAQAYWAARMYRCALCSYIRNYPLALDADATPMEYIPPGINIMPLIQMHCFVHGGETLLYPFDAHIEKTANPAGTPISLWPPSDYQNYRPETLYIDRRTNKTFVVSPWFELQNEQLSKRVMVKPPTPKHMPFTKLQRPVSPPRVKWEHTKTTTSGNTDIVKLGFGQLVTALQHLERATALCSVVSTSDIQNWPDDSTYLPGKRLLEYVATSAVSAVQGLNISKMRPDRLNITPSERIAASILWKISTDPSFVVDLTPPPVEIASPLVLTNFAPIVKKTRPREPPSSQTSQQPTQQPQHVRQKEQEEEELLEPRPKRPKRIPHPHQVEPPQQKRPTRGSTKGTPKDGPQTSLQAPVQPHAPPVLDIQSQIPQTTQETRPPRIPPPPTLPPSPLQTAPLPPHPLPPHPLPPAPSLSSPQVSVLPPQPVQEELRNLVYDVHKQHLAAAEAARLSQQQTLQQQMLQQEIPQTHTQVPQPAASTSASSRPPARTKRPHSEVDDNTSTAIKIDKPGKPSSKPPPVKKYKT